MPDEPSWDELLASPTRTSVREGGAEPSGSWSLGDTVEPFEDSGPEAEDPGDTGSERPPRRRRESDRPRRRFGLLWVLLGVLVFTGILGSMVWNSYGEQISSLMGWTSDDYSGDGTGQVEIVIKKGDSGGTIAKTLAAAGVTKTFDAFYHLLLSQEKEPTFQPGTFRLAKGMSAQSALDALRDPANHVVDRVVIPEGTTVAGVLKRINSATGIPLDELQSAAKDYTSFGIPEAAPNLEGYLFPATYSFDPGATAHDILQRMVDEMVEHLDKAGVAEADRHRVLTMAGLIQKEGGTDADFYKVSRVFYNRLDKGWKLESDATVSYGIGGTTVATTKAERADASNPYNTYVHKGLPIGPISNPGDAAIDAALHPAKGPWLYFVLVNGETGETKFSTTLAQHNAAVKEWQAWYRAHPNYDK